MRTSSSLTSTGSRRVLAVLLIITLSWTIAGCLPPPRRSRPPAPPHPGAWNPPHGVGVNRAILG